MRVNTGGKWNNNVHPKILEESFATLIVITQGLISAIPACRESLLLNLFCQCQSRREKFRAPGKKKRLGPYSSEKSINDPHGSDKAINGHHNSDKVTTGSHDSDKAIRDPMLYVMIKLQLLIIVQPNLSFVIIHSFVRYNTFWGSGWPPSRQAWPVYTTLWKTPAWQQTNKRWSLNIPNNAIAAAVHFKYTHRCNSFFGEKYPIKKHLKYTDTQNGFTEISTFFVFGQYFRYFITFVLVHTLFKTLNQSNFHPVFCCLLKINVFLWITITKQSF